MRVQNNRSILLAIFYCYFSKADRHATLVQSLAAKSLYKSPRYEKHKYRGKIKIREEESEEKEGEI